MMFSLKCYLSNIKYKTSFFNIMANKIYLFALRDFIYLSSDIKDVANFDPLIQRSINKY